jgi:6-phosphogluconolactonase
MDVPSKVELLRFPDATELAKAAALTWVDQLAQRTTPNDNYCVALPGGRAAAIFFRSSVELIRSRNVSLADVHFFWADERCVPPDGPDSNFAVAHQEFFAPLAISQEQIHRIRGEADPQFAVAEAEAELCRVASLQPDGTPVFDLVLLGMGEDGHVASLFPGAPAAISESRMPFLHITDSPKPPPERITVSYPILVAAREVWVLVSGKGKDPVLRASLSATGWTPVERVVQSRQRTRIFTDVLI